MNALGGLTGSSFIITATPTSSAVKRAKFSHCKADSIHAYAHCSDHVSGAHLNDAIELYDGEHTVTATVLAPNGEYEKGVKISFTTVNGKHHEER